MFFANLIDCEILYFKALGYSMLGYFCAKMKSSEKFQKYYMNALKLKKQQKKYFVLFFLVYLHSKVLVEYK